MREEKSIESQDQDEASDAEEVKPRRETSYFIMKCNNEKNMSIAFERSIWATTKGNEKRLKKAYQNSEEVYLIFSIQGSGHFQGVAKMISSISDEQCEDFGSANLGGVFEIEWIHKERIPFQFTQHLTNPWNDHKKVQISRDAQEVEPSVGDALIRLWDHTPDSPKETQSLPEEVVSPSEKEEEDSGEFYQEPVYSENEANYMEGYPVYSPPPFGPQYMHHEFQHVPPSHFAPPPPPHMYQQPYPAYPPPEPVTPYRHQLYYPVAPPYTSPRRGAPHDMYGRSGQYPNGRHDGRPRGGSYRP